MKRVVEHPPLCNPFTGEQGPSPIEFFLPVERSQIPEGTPLPEAFDPVADNDKATATKWLSARHGQASTPGVAAFVQWFSRCKPMSLLLLDEQWCLRCSLGRASNYKVGSNFYMYPPLGVNVINEVLDDFGLEDDTFAEFMQLFHGLREDMPPTLGDFAYDELTPFSDTQWAEDVDEVDAGSGWSDEVDELEQLELWLDACCLYHARNGDILLLNEHGQTGWFYHEESRVESYSKSFEEFLARYLRFVRGRTGVFDALSSSNV